MANHFCILALRTHGQYFACSYLNFTLLSTSGLSPRGERPLVELYLEPGVFSERGTGKLPLRVDFIHRLEFGEAKNCVE